MFHERPRPLYGGFAHKFSILCAVSAVEDMDRYLANEEGAQ